MSTDLRELMHERSTVDASVGGAVRLGQVRRRIARIRRRRRVATALSVVLVALTAAALVPGVARTPGPGQDPSPQASYTFPDYVGTFQLRATASVGTPTAVLELPTRTDTLVLTLLLRCEPDILVRVQVNFNDIYQGSCGPQPQAVPVDVAVVMPVLKPRALLVFTVSATTGKDFDSPPENRRPIPAEGSIALGVYERAFPAYPPPSRPAALQPLTFDVGTSVQLARIDSDPANPLQTMSATVPHSEWPLSLRVRAQTPGLLRIQVNGLLIHTYDSVDYEAREIAFDFAGLALEPGTPVTIEVVPEGMTGAWAVVILEL